MLLKRLTNFDNVIIVFVTSQPKSIYLKKFNKKYLQHAKNLTSITYQSVLDRGANLPLPVQIGVKITQKI